MAYDAVLVVSFGGPEGPEDVVPYLENVTRGRGIPRERLAEVGAHYAHFDGVSPINAENRALVAALRKSLSEGGPDLPVYWGNRNWHPFLDETLAAMRDDGVGNALAFVTSAYSSYSGCRQYRENLAAARLAVPGAPELDRIRQFYDHPAFIDCFVRAALDALRRLPAEDRPACRLVFTAHSLPTAAAEASGPEGARGAYVAQLREASRLVADRVALEAGRFHPWDLVFQSRSGPPEQPWLEPDVSDHLDVLAARGVPGVVVVPIGFVADHLEVVWDLDTVAAEHAATLGLHYERASTPRVDPAFVAMVRDLIRERVDPAAPRAALGRLGPSWDTCDRTCCLPVRGEPLPVIGERPAAGAMTTTSPAESPSDEELVGELYALAVAVAEETARFLVEERPRDLRAAGTKSSPTDVVTAMDTAAERMIAERILRDRPHDAFLGEEGTQGADAGARRRLVTDLASASTPMDTDLTDRTATASRVRWVVDPIDGTVNYLYDIPGWAVSVAAELDGVVVAGAVVNPVVGDTFAARRGGGATRNGAPISVGAALVQNATGLSRALVATGFGYDPERRREQAATARTVIGAVGDIRRFGAASLDLCALACGRVDGYYERGLKPWDLAAGGLVATEAGARVEGLHGAPAGERIVIAAGQGLFDALHALLVEAGA